MLATALCCSLLPTAGQAYTPEQQQACSGDAFRLCGPEIPDVDRVTACMIARKAELSPGCRVFFRPGPEPVAESERADEHPPLRAQACRAQAAQAQEAGQNLRARNRTCCLTTTWT